MREIDKVFQRLFSPDDRLIVAAGRDGTVRAWDWRAGRLAAPVMRHDTEVFGLAMTGEGRHLLTLTAHGRLRAWDSHHGPPALTLDPGRPARRLVNERRRITWRPPRRRRRAEGLPGLSPVRIRRARRSPPG